MSWGQWAFGGLSIGERDPGISFQRTCPIRLMIRQGQFRGSGWQFWSSGLAARGVDTEALH